MIKIITPGKLTYKATCPVCGCVFEYEAADITMESVECPTCKHFIRHYREDITFPGIGWPAPGESIPCNIPSDTGLNPCANCDWWKKMQQPGFTYVGDTPCTWCQHGKFYAAVSSASSSSACNK